MNINDVEDREVKFKGDKLEAIFNRQLELMEKYHKIEKANGLLQTEKVPVPLPCFHSITLNQFVGFLPA